MKWTSPLPAGGGKPFPKFSHPPWPWGVGGAGPAPLFPDPWLTLWPGCGREKGLVFPSTPSPNTLWDYSGIAILGLTLLCLVFGLHPAVGTGAWKCLPTAGVRRWGCPFPPRGDQRRWIRGVGEQKGCLCPCASQAWFRRRAQPPPCKGTPRGPGGLLGDLRFSPSPSLMLRSDLNTCGKLITCICAF